MSASDPPGDETILSPDRPLPGDEGEVAPAGVGPSSRSGGDAAAEEPLLAGGRSRVREPARGTRLALVALWLVYLPVWVVVLAVATPSVPVVLVAFALFALLLARLHQSLRRKRCARCGERYYGPELLSALVESGCAGCGR